MARQSFMVHDFPERFKRARSVNPGAALRAFLSLAQDPPHRDAFGGIESAVRFVLEQCA